MPMEKWKELEKKLSKAGFKVSWQEGLTDLYEYMDWVNSCKVIISQDSLCIHMALAFKKMIIGLFGPTDPQEIYSYGNSRIIHTKQKCEIMPCYRPVCSTQLNCMEHIELDQIVEETRDALCSLKG